MAISRSTYGTRRLAIVLFACLCRLFSASQSQRLLQYVGGPLGRVLSLPLAFSCGSWDFRNWNGYVALQTVHEENRQLRRDIELLKGEQSIARVRRGGAAV